MPHRSNPFSSSLFIILGTALANTASAINGGPVQVNTYNGWKAFEVITRNDNPTGSWPMPANYDGLGAQLMGGSTLRVQVNHENSDATISEVNLDLAAFQTAINNVINTSSTGGVKFVDSARQAYDRWSADGGTSWTDTSNTSNTSFSRFCSGQSYVANMFGSGRGFADGIYITGEEVGGGSLFGIDLANRDFYELSGVSGSAPGGLGGMPFDPWENAALLDTGETDHIALLLSPDGGTRRMKLYIGEKGKDASGDASTSFLARNGLAYGSHYYLNDSLPSIGDPSTDGFFDTTIGGALNSSKLEDVDTSLADPTMVVLGDQDSGLFTFDFNLDFQSGSFDAAQSDFSITKIQNDNASGSGSFNNPDNVDWTDATTLDGTTFADGLIFVNEDSGEGEIWMMNPDGTGLVRVGDTISNAESSGILDISTLVGYNPGSVLFTSDQGSNSSLSVLINPAATPIPEPSSLLLVALGLFGMGFSRKRLAEPAVPEPGKGIFLIDVLIGLAVVRRR